MKYAIHYHTGFRYMNEVDEVIIKFNNRNFNLIPFLEEKSQEQRIIVDITSIAADQVINYLPDFIRAVGVHKNLALRISIEQRDFMPDFYENNIPFFFDELVDTWDKLVSFVQLQVSDIYIVSDLGFDLKDVAAYCKKNNVYVRVFPNVSQFSTPIGNLDRIKGFFIRPEDIFIYEEYVDICEFWGELDRQSVYYEIYTKQNWLGNLNEIIANCNIDIGNKTIAPLFATLRLECKKKCYRGLCKKCDRIVATGKALDEKHLIIKENKG